MFDNRKIKHLRKLPEGNNIVLIWVMLLTMAGRCNSGGMIFLTENIPYTPKMLADELGFEENTVKLALEALEQFEMIVSEERFFSIAGWQEHQNIEGMEKIREQTRKRVAKYREKSKQNDVTLQVTCRNAIEEEREEEKERENTPPISPQGERAGEKTKKKEPEVYFPDNEQLEETFKEFLTMRNKIKKPLVTKKAITRAKNKLDKLSKGNDEMAILILEQSIDHCWQDLYELKPDQNGGGNNGRAGSDVGEVDRDEYAEQFIALADKSRVPEMSRDR